MTTVYSYDRRAKALRPNYGVSHFLVYEPHSGPGAGFLSIVGFEDDVPCLMGNIGFEAAKGCPGAMAVEYAEAASGLGPALYDAAMEFVYPKGLTSAVLTSTSGPARSVWRHYYTNRPDVFKEPKPAVSQCRQRGTEELDHVYFKRPGASARAVITVPQLNKILQQRGYEVIRSPVDDLPECSSMAAV